MPSPVLFTKKNRLTYSLIYLLEFKLLYSPLG
nr:MAG TPA: hypothetical protein [Caudoviricetes sp.]